MWHLEFQLKYSFDLLKIDSKESVSVLGIINSKIWRGSLLLFRRAKLWLIRSPFEDRPKGTEVHNSLWKQKKAWNLYFVWTSSAWIENNERAFSEKVFDDRSRCFGRKNRAIGRSKCACAVQEAIIYFSPKLVSIEHSRLPTLCFASSRKYAIPEGIANRSESSCCRGTQCGRTIVHYFAANAP